MSSKKAIGRAKGLGGPPMKWPEKDGFAGLFLLKRYIFRVFSCEEEDVPCETVVVVRF